MEERNELTDQLDQWTERQNSANRKSKDALKRFLSQTAYSEELKKEIDRQEAIFLQASEKRMEIIGEIIEKHKRACHQQRLERLRSRKS
jgi:DNA-binding ferritin-like protein